MRDADCVAFLQWALPRLGLSWPGFRKVRRQVCKRLGRRMRALGMAELEAYRLRLETDAQEWSVLDSLCRVTNSRFYRDRGVFDHLRTRVLPDLAHLASARGRGALKCWSAGCASGEEPYTLKILWELEVRPRFPDLRLVVTATDWDATMLGRAREGRYGKGSLKDLPGAWRAAAFEPAGGLYHLAARFRDGVSLARQDIRSRMPRGPFDLVLCRNLVFTYFDENHQRRVSRRIARRLGPGGVLVLGKHESLPGGMAEFVAWAPKLPIYVRRGEDEEAAP